MRRGLVEYFFTNLPYSLLPYIIRYITLHISPSIRPSNSVIFDIILKLYKAISENHKIINGAVLGIVLNHLHNCVIKQWMGFVNARSLKRNRNI